MSASLPVNLAQRFTDILASGARRAEQRWETFTEAAGAAAEDIGGHRRDPDVPDDPFLFAAVGVDVSEPGADRSRNFAGPLQRALTRVLDEARHCKLTAELVEAGNDSDIRRLEELRAGEDQDRSWLWSIRRGVEPSLEAADYALAVRAMLGASFLIEPMLCSGCGNHILDIQGRHALCCMGSATTIGHNCVRDVIATGLAVADPGTIVEPMGLVPSRPELRPAYVLS